MWVWARLLAACSAASIFLAALVYCYARPADGWSWIAIAASLPVGLALGLVAYPVLRLQLSRAPIASSDPMDVLLRREQGAVARWRLDALHRQIPVGHGALFAVVCSITPLTIVAVVFGVVAGSPKETSMFTVGTYALLWVQLSWLPHLVVGYLAWRLVHRYWEALQRGEVEPHWAVEALKVSGVAALTGFPCAMLREALSQTGVSWSSFAASLLSVFVLYVAGVCYLPMLFC